MSYSCSNYAAIVAWLLLQLLLLKLLQLFLVEADISTLDGVVATALAVAVAAALAAVAASAVDTASWKTPLLLRHWRSC